MIMDENERTKKDLKKLREIIKFFKLQGFSKKYPYQLEFAENYYKDANYYYEKKEYFSSFGCTNYAYGILESILLKEKGKPFHELRVE